jgi:hypothetical protein
MEENISQFVLTQYFTGNQIKKMSEKHLVSLGKTRHARSRLRWENNIKEVLADVWCKYVNWIELDELQSKWRITMTKS